MEVSFSSLDKVMYPETGFTKGDLIAYYERIAPVLLPHVRDRPMTLGRFPDGVDGPGFAQTECRGAPDWLATAPIRLRSGAVRNYCLVNDLRSLLWVANLGTIELHPFLAPADRLDRPAGVLFDLDPEEPARLAAAARVALLVRDELARRDLSPLVKTSGSTGMHVFVPLERSPGYEATRALAREVAELIAEREPGVVARAGPREERAGAVLVDWAQNHERRSTIAPYSLRAADRPAVSAPLSWDEVAELAAGEALELGPEEVLDRAARSGDLFSPR
jgi:bifunctional non-homologous end joining protein LigD